MLCHKTALIRSKCAHLIEEQSKIMNKEFNYAILVTDSQHHYCGGNTICITITDEENNYLLRDLHCHG